jgi:hypothetical protein
MRAESLSHPIDTSIQIGGVRTWPVLMLVSRILLFAAWQAVIAGIITLLGGDASWEASAAWWPVTATLTNIVSIALLVILFNQEGKRYRELFRFEQATWKVDLLVVLGLTVLSAALVMLPNFGLATWLFGDAQVTMELFYRPLPIWAVLVSMVAFPLTIALAELPTYFGYAMPRLGRGVWPVVAAAFFLSIQHAALPLLLDWRFILWRAAMFLPFALVLAIVLHWRPRLLPYLVVVHALLDLTAVWFLFPVAY